MPVVRAHRLGRVAALVEEPADVLRVGSRSIAGLSLTKLAVFGPADLWSLRRLTNGASQKAHRPISDISRPASQTRAASNSKGARL
jgi:hypothetical protein